jgi:hypothetical protein
MGVHNRRKTGRGMWSGGGFWFLLIAFIVFGYIALRIVLAMH